MRTAVLRSQRHDHPSIALKVAELVGVDDVAQVAGDHCDSLLLRRRSRMLHVRSRTVRTAFRRLKTAGEVLLLLDNETGMHSCLATKPSVAGWHRRQEEASPWSREYRHPNGQARSSVSC